MGFIEPKDRAITINDLAEADYDYIAMIRTSTTEQQKSIEQQQEDVIKRMSQLGFKKPVFIEVSNVSGAKEDREQMQTIIEFIRALPESKRNLILVARDAARFARNAFIGLRDQRELESLGCYLYILNSNLLVGGKGVEQGTTRLIFQILMSVQTFGKFDEKIASEKGRQKAKREKGIQGGTGRDTFRENIPKSGKQKGKSIYRRIAESEGAIQAGTASIKGLARDLTTSRRTVYPRTVRGIRAEIKEVKDAVGEKGLERWLNVWDELIRYEGFRSVGRISKPPTRGNRAQAFRQSEKARALWRVAQGYISNPKQWNDPVDVGNPQVATFVDPKNTGTLEHAYNNPLKYLPAAR